MSNARYTPEFKDEAVRQVVERKHSVAEVAVERFHEGVLCWFLWLNKVQLDVALFRPENIALQVSSGPLSQTMVFGRVRSSSLRKRIRRLSHCGYGPAFISACDK